MRKFLILVLTSVILTYFESAAQKDNVSSDNNQLDEIYHRTWVELNKNGKKKIYEDSCKGIDDRIDDQQPLITYRTNPGSKTE